MPSKWSAQNEQCTTGWFLIPLLPLFVMRSPLAIGVLMRASKLGGAVTSSFLRPVHRAADHEPCCDEDEVLDHKFSGPCQQQRISRLEGELWAQHQHEKRSGHLQPKEQQDQAQRYARQKPNPYDELPPAQEPYEECRREPVHCLRNQVGHWAAADDF